MFHRIQALLTIALAASLLVSTIVVQGQKLDPSYLSEMPTPARVLSEIKGKDPEDTVERQMGAFMMLDKIIEDMAYGLEHRTYLSLKPDEARMQKAYNDAFAQLYAVIKRADHKYDHDHDRDLFNEVLAKLFSPSFRDLYFQADAKGGAQLRANFQKMYGSPSNSASGNAAEDDAHKLCAAKGLDDFTCMMQTMMKTIVNVADATSAPIKPGLSLNGAYRAAKFQVALRPDRTFTMTCGGVVRLSNYTIETKNNQIFVSVKNDQDSFAFRLQPDGRTLVGPGQVSIHGYAPGGSRAVTTTQPGSSQQVTKTTQRELTPLEAQQYPDAVKNGQTYTVTETTTSTEYTPPTTTTTTAPAYHAASAVVTLRSLSAPTTSATNAASFLLI